MDNLTLNQFLKEIATLDNGDAINLIRAFRAGLFCVEGLSVNDFAQNE